MPPLQDTTGPYAAIPNVSVLLTPLTTQEAVLSSRIEGTEATMGEVLEQVDDLQTARQRLPGRCMLQGLSNGNLAGQFASFDKFFEECLLLSSSWISTTGN